MTALYVSGVSGRSGGAACSASLDDFASLGEQRDSTYQQQLRFDDSGEFVTCRRGRRRRSFLGSGEVVFVSLSSKIRSWTEGTSEALRESSFRSVGLE